LALEPGPDAKEHEKQDPDPKISHRWAGILCQQSNENIGTEPLSKLQHFLYILENIQYSILELWIIR